MCVGDSCCDSSPLCEPAMWKMALRFPLFSCPQIVKMLLRPRRFGILDGFGRGLFQWRIRVVRQRHAQNNTAYNYSPTDTIIGHMRSLFCKLK